jgi:hypothetical protein
MAFDVHRKALSEFFRKGGYRMVRYLDWSDAMPTPLFLDHCHLTKEGNARLAGRLAGEIQGGKP